MPLLRKAFLTPIQGLDYSKPSTLINYENGFPQNVRIDKEIIRKRFGKTLFGQQLASAIMHLAQYALTTGDIRLIAITQYGAYKYNTSSEKWEDITGVQLTGGDANHFSTCVAEDKFLITNSIDNIRTYNDAGNTADLAGSPPKGKYMEYLSPYLIVAHLTSGTSYHSKIQWCDTGDITDWATGNAGSALLTHTPGDIRAIKNINEYAAIYKKDAVYLARKVATADAISTDLVQTDIGLLSPRALVGLKGFHYFMGLQDFYVNNGARIEPIGKAVRDTVFSTLNDDKSTTHFALVMEEEREIWFFVTPSGQNTPTTIWKFNYENGFWYYDTCSSVRTASLFYNQSSVLIDDMTGLIDSYTDVFDNIVGANKPIIIFGDQTGKCLQYDSATVDDNGVAVDGYWQSMDFLAENLENYKRWLQMDFNAKGNSVKVSYSTDYGSTWTLIKNQTLTNEFANYRIYFDIVADKIRFKFQNDTLGKSFQLKQFQAYWLQREEINR